MRHHFRWMREYGIDGAFVQRFATTTLKPRTRMPADRVLSHCPKAAAAEGRKWVLMYDLSGLKNPSLYLAMFDELDEGRAVFKVSQDPPVGASPFVSEPGLPTDHYLWLSGEIGKMLGGERGMEFPSRQ